MKYSQYKLRKAKIKLIEKTNSRCQWCGKHIDPPNTWNFAHVKGKNVGTKKDAESNFVFVCKALHEYQTIRAINLELDPCVSSYLEAGGGGKGHHFFDVLLAKIK